MTRKSPKAKVGDLIIYYYDEEPYVAFGVVIKILKSKRREVFWADYGESTYEWELLFEAEIISV